MPEVHGCTNIYTWSGRLCLESEVCLFVCLRD